MAILSHQLQSKIQRDKKENYWVDINPVTFKLRDIAMKYAQLFMILLFCFGCQKMDKVVIDSGDFTEEELEIMISAAEDLFTAVPEMRVPVYLDDDAIVNKVYKRVDNCGKGHGALTIFKPGIPTRIKICWDDDAYPGYKYYAFQHELVHGITGSISHLKEDGHVMSKTLSKISDGVFVNITPGDIEFIRKKL